MNLALDIIYTISPLFLIILIGYIAIRVNWIASSSLPSLARIAYYITAPAFLIDVFSRLDFSQFSDLSSYIAIPITMIVISALAYHTCKKAYPTQQVSVISQAAFRPNALFVGLPLSLIILGEDGLKYATLGLMMTTPLSNSISVFLFTYIANRSHDFKQLLKSIFKIVLNPLILSSLFGLILSLFREDSSSQIVLIDKVLHSLKSATFPIALLNIGATLYTSKASAHKPRAIIILPLFYKLVLSPILLMILMYLMGATPIQFMAVGILFAAPVASFSYIITLEFKADKDLSAKLILYSTILSFFSYNVMLLILAALNLWHPIP